MSRVLSVDTEYGWHEGGECLSAFVPVVCCFVEQGTRRRYHFWGRDRRLGEFLGDHAGALFISHNLKAEAKYFQSLGVKPPRNWWDTMLARRYLSNAERPARYGLEISLEHYGIPHRYSAHKEELQKWIGELRFDPGNPDDRRTILAYCYEDCAATLSLYERIRDRVPAAWMDHVVRFCLALSRMEMRGVGIDMDSYRAIESRRAEVVQFFTDKVHETAPGLISEKGSLRGRVMLKWCARMGMGWPRKFSKAKGKKVPYFDEEARKIMIPRHPFIARVHETLKVVKSMVGRQMAIDPLAGLHFFHNNPLGTATGRTTFKNYVFSGPKLLRLLIVPRSPEHVLVSVDFVAEEILIRAWLAHDDRMIADYEATDFHMAFAISAGAAPAGATKNTHEAVRKLYKEAGLAINYGSSEYGIALSTGKTVAEARQLLRQHMAVYHKGHEFSDRYTLNAFRKGWAFTKLGFPRAVGKNDNPRSVANYFVQGTGADLMQLAVIYLDEMGAPLIATNHDGFVFDCPRDQLDELRRVIDRALRRAVERVLPGAPMRWDVAVYGDRYRDEDGEKLWNEIAAFLGLKEGVSHAV
jgi:DNA polymerase I-like protein with 3'-5' exonuclease and polymerase domains